MDKLSEFEEYFSLPSSYKDYDNDAWLYKFGSKVFKFLKGSRRKTWIGIINYGLGNVQCLLIVINARIPSISISDKKDLKRVDRLILLGVGSLIMQLKD